MVDEAVLLRSRLDELQLALNSAEQSDRYYARLELAGKLPQIIAALAKPVADDEVREHISEQIQFAETRIQDGIEIGAAAWRLALEDIVKENRALLQRMKDRTDG